MVADFSGAQSGDISSGDIAQTITHIHTQLGDVMAMLERDIAAHDLRIASLEESQRQYQSEKQSLTRLLIGARNESQTVKDVHELLKVQITTERGEREQRRQWLDRVLAAVLVLSLSGFLADIYRVFGGKQHTII